MAFDGGSVYSWISFVYALCVPNVDVVSHGMQAHILQSNYFTN